MLINDATQTRAIQRRLRHAALALARNSRLPLPPHTRPIPALSERSLRDALSPALTDALIQGRLRADAAVEIFVSLLAPGLDPVAGLRRWRLGYRFLARHLPQLQDAGFADLADGPLDLHWRFWSFFAVADFDPCNRIPALEDCLAYLELDVDDGTEDWPEPDPSRPGAANPRLH